MLEAVRTLATVADYTEKQLKDIACEFGNNQPIPCEIRVGVLVRACREYASYRNPSVTVTTCARIVALSEQLVDYTGSQESSDFAGMFLALKREIDNLRNYSRATSMEVG